jgi:hypothetical protein
MAFYIPTYYKAVTIVFHISSSFRNEFPNNSHFIGSHNFLFFLHVQIFYWVFQYEVTIMEVLKNPVPFHRLIFSSAL